MNELTWHATELPDRLWLRCHSFVTERQYKLIFDATELFLDQERIRLAWRSNMEEVVVTFHENRVPVTGTYRYGSVDLIGNLMYYGVTKDSRKVLADLVREFVGNPFRRWVGPAGNTTSGREIYPAPVPDVTPAAKRMAEEIFVAGDWSGLPYLADHLEEDGWTQDHPVLLHLRNQVLKPCPVCTEIDLTSVVGIEAALPSIVRKEKFSPENMVRPGYRQCKTCVRSTGLLWAPDPAPCHRDGCWVVDLLLGVGGPAI